MLSQLDPHCASRPGNSYPIHSLYLDSENLALYWNTVSGLKNPYKLRLRYYDSEPESPVCFEIKRRSSEALFEQRGAVRREFVNRILAGESPGAHLVSHDPRQVAAVQNFCEFNGYDSSLERSLPFWVSIPPGLTLYPAELVALVIKR